MSQQYWFRRLLFPRRCGFCGVVIHSYENLCDTCRSQALALYNRPPLCPYCGRQKQDCICGGHRRLFERVVAPFVYRGGVRNGVIRLKYHSKRYTARFFASQMAQAVWREYGNTHFAGIVPVPMSHKQRKKRGYNPSLWLAQELSAHIGAPVTDVLLKITETRPQKELSALERTGNLLGTIDLRPNVTVAGSRYLLVDDVTTTGATLNECAKMLKIYGAIQVLAVTAAVTVRTEETEEYRYGGNGPRH